MSDYLVFNHITMEFPGVKALDDMSFTVNKGEVVAFLGENGAGKSTLLKILNGDYHHTSGNIYINDKEVNFATPHDAIKSGISVIYQERQLAPFLSVAENIFLGNPPMKGRFIDFKELNKMAQEIIDEFNLPIKPTDRVRDISVAYQQMVEIMKSYARNADIICFDEPTAPLTDNEISVLFRIIRKLKAENKAIMYVSHRMSEIFKITDRVIVFKDGKLVGVRNTNETNNKELVQMMVGRDLGDVFNNLDRNKKFGRTILKLNNISNEKIKNISFEVHEGEILGLSGLVGAGRTEIARAIFGADQIKKGKMYFEGKGFIPKSPREAMDIGIALCPEDRKVDGLSLFATMETNCSLAILKNLTHKGVVDKVAEDKFTEESIKEFNIKTPTKDQITNNLSGGNQQKTILARWMGMNPKVMILDEPTKGIDVGAKSEIYNMVCNIAKKGVAVIFISSELPEILGLSDRILVLKDGEIRGEFMRGDENTTEEEIIKYAMLDKSEMEE